jgi:hypothetical protein
MVKECKIENLTFIISEEGSNIRVIGFNSSTILSNQDVETVCGLINHNFKMVRNHYKSMLNGSNIGFEEFDISSISFLIVMFYLYMYNTWKSSYKKQENKDLHFNLKDFNNPSTRDIIFNYYKTKYPIDWEIKCAILIGMELNELKAYYKNRLAFYNK